MTIRTTSDSNWETRASKAREELQPVLQHALENKSYGTGIETIHIVFMCRNPDHKFRQRRKWSKDESKFATDIMLPYQDMVDGDELARVSIVAQALLSQLPTMIRAKKVELFDVDKFEKDLRSTIKRKGWI